MSDGAAASLVRAAVELCHRNARPSADIALDFDALDGGFSLPADADRVDPTRDRPHVHQPGAAGLCRRIGSDVRGAGWRRPRRSSDIRCDGSGSVLAINDAVAPEHGLRIATAYDDMYNLPPERIVQAIERLGYRGTINHYVGMSHFFALGRRREARPGADAQCGGAGVAPGIRAGRQGAWISS